MELERESKTNVLQSAGGNPLPSGPERFTGLSKIEGRFMLHSVFDSLVETKHQVEKLTATAHKRDEGAIEAAVEQQRVKAREQIKKLKFEHSEAMMTLMEATKGAVEHKVGMEIMEAAGNTGGMIDADLKNTVDEMLGGFLDGFSKVGDELFTEFENMKEEDRKEKERAEAKVSEPKTSMPNHTYGRPAVADAFCSSQIKRDKERKKMKKVIWKPEVEEEEEEEDDFVDAGEMSDEEDSDWGETPVKKKPKKKQEKEDLDKSVIEDEIVQMLDDDSDKVEEIGEEKLRKMKVAELKLELKKRGLLVGGKKEELVQRLLEYEASEGKDGMDISGSSASELNLSGISSSSSSEKSEDKAEIEEAEVAKKAVKEEKELTPYAKKVRKVPVKEEVKPQNPFKGLAENKPVTKPAAAPKLAVASMPAAAAAPSSVPYWKSVASENDKPNKPAEDRMQRLKEWRLKQQQQQQQQGGGALAGGPARPSIGGVKRTLSSGSDGGGQAGVKKVRREAMNDVMNKLNTFSKEMGFEKKGPMGAGAGVGAGAGAQPPVKRSTSREKERTGPPRWN